MNQCEAALDSNRRCQKAPRHVTVHEYFDAAHNEVWKWGRPGGGETPSTELIRPLRVPGSQLGTEAPALQLEMRPK